MQPTYRDRPNPRPQRVTFQRSIYMHASLATRPNGLDYMHLFCMCTCKALIRVTITMPYRSLGYTTEGMSDLKIHELYGYIKGGNSDR